MTFASLLRHVCAAMTFVDGDHISVRCCEDRNGGWYTLLALYYLPGNGARMTHCGLLLGCTTALTVIWSGSGAVNVPTCWSWNIYTGHWRDIVAVFVKCQTLPHFRSYLLPLVCISMCIAWGTILCGVGHLSRAIPTCRMTYSWQLIVVCRAAAVLRIRVNEGHIMNVLCEVGDQPSLLSWYL